MKGNALYGIDGLSGLGELRPGLKKAIYENKSIVAKVLKQSEHFFGLGFVEGKKVNFQEVVKMYNEGISEAEIKAWVWYKCKQGIPMTHWNQIYKIADSDVQDLVKVGALFISGKEYLPLPIYSFGNMYERRDQLMQDKEHITKTFGKEIFENHQKIVSEAIPKQLSVTETDPKERPIIMAISEIARNKDVFCIKSVRPEYMDTENAEQLTKVNGKISVKRDSSSAKYKVIRLRFDGDTDYSLRDVFVKWLYTLQQADFDKSNAIDIAEYYIYSKPLKDDELTSDQKAELKVIARNEGEKLFSRFLHEVLTPDDQKKLDETWNRMFNAQSDINHKRVPVGFECSSRFKSGLLQITPIQREGVAFFEALGSGICAFDVGVGKTMTAIINIAANIYSGKCKRPLVVVPKPTYKKWIGEIIGFTDKNTNEFVPGVLSYTNIKLNDWSNLGTGIKEKLNFSKQVPENSITIVTYEGFKQIGFSGNVSDELFTQLVNILGQSTEKSARDAEIDYQKYREKIGMGEKNTVCDIDTLGFDYLVIDEAHRCKNVFEQVKSDDEGNKRYNITSAVSETGIKAFFHANYIQRNFGNNVMLLTATPFVSKLNEFASKGKTKQKAKLTQKGDEPQKLKASDIPEIVKKFMPKFQQEFIIGSEEHFEIVQRLENEIKAIPKDTRTADKAYEKAKKNSKANYMDFYTVYAHFFYSGSDWYVLSWDGDEILFCYVILNGDTQMSEMGDVALSELHENKIELDFFWEVKSLSEALYNAYPGEFPKPGDENKTNKLTTPENEAEKAQSKAEPESTMVEKVGIEISFIKRYVGLNGKIKEKQQILTFLNSLQKAILEKRIRKTSPFAKEIQNIQSQLIKCYGQMGNTIQINIDDKTLEAYSTIAQSEKTMLSVTYIKQYIGIHGKQGVKEKATALLDKLEKGRIPETCPYWSEIQEIKVSLKNYIGNKTKSPTISESTLNGIMSWVVKRQQKKKISKYLQKIYETERGLKGIPDELENVTTSKSSVISSTSLPEMKFETIGLNGKYRELIGDPSEGFTAMVFGLPKSGKSTLCIDFARHLAEHHGKVLYVAIEEGFGYTLKEKFERLNAIHPNLVIAEKLPADLSAYKFVFIDSVSKARLTSQDLTAIKKENPKTAFVFIFHSTKEGNFRGQQDFAHDVDVIINVENGIAKANGRFGVGGRMDVF